MIVRIKFCQRFLNDFCAGSGKIEFNEDFHEVEISYEGNRSFLNDHHAHGVILIGLNITISFRAEINL